MGEEKGEKEEEGGEEDMEEEEEGRGCIEGGSLGWEGRRCHPSLLNSTQLEAGAGDRVDLPLVAVSVAASPQNLAGAGGGTREAQGKGRQQKNEEGIGWKGCGGGVVG